MDIPKIISVDDHVVEPQSLWVDRAPRSIRDEVPRVERQTGKMIYDRSQPKFIRSDDADAVPCDVWVYEDMRFPLSRGFAATGFAREERIPVPVTYDEIRPGCFDQSARLADMALNHTEASLSFPTVPRFCGQTFLERKNHDIALECVKIYNDWMIDEWCGGEGAGHLIPLTLIPLWDPQLAATEVRRCAEKGSHAIAFSEGPPALGLPSVYSDHWLPLIQACDETQTVINLHIGSSSKLTSTAPDNPPMTVAVLTFEGAMHACVDWLLSGMFERFPGIKVALSEGQVGWLPFILERADNAWINHAAFSDHVANLRERVPNLPSSYVPGHLYGCLFDDIHGLRSRDTIGMKQLMFEIDYPHGDSTWPNSKATAEKLCLSADLSDDEAYQLLRGNAIECYGLQRFGIDH
jgi:predicted TIM-barrel fold metal-dependent hydrolase